MSSFYKSNLMDGYDALLIPPEKDAKTEERTVKIDNVPNVETNTQTKNSTKVLARDYPYKNIINGSRYMIYAAGLLCAIYEFSLLTIDNNCCKNIILETFLEPCNLPDVVPLNELEHIKYKINTTHFEKMSIDVVEGYNISIFTNEYLTEKYANLTTTANNLTKQIEQQKGLRKICFKQNLEQKFKEQFALKHYYFYLYLFGGIVYGCIFVILSTVSFYYISKGQNLKLTPEQENAYKFDKHFLQVICGHHVITAIFTFYVYIFSSFNCEDDLKSKLKEFFLANF